MAIRPDIKKLLVDNKVWKKFYTTRDARKAEGATRLQLDGILAGFIVACPGGKAYLDDEGLPLINSKDVHLRKKDPNQQVGPATSDKIQDVLTEEEINTLVSKPEATASQISNWVSAAFLRNLSDIDFTSAPDVRAVTLYFAYADDLSKYHRDVLIKSLKFDKKEDDEAFDGATLAFFCSELREINQTADLRGAQNERDLEDKRQAVLHG